MTRKNRCPSKRRLQNITQTLTLDDKNELDKKILDVMDKLKKLKEQMKDCEESKPEKPKTEEQPEKQTNPIEQSKPEEQPKPELVCSNKTKNFRCGPNYGSSYCPPKTYCSYDEWCGTTEEHQRRTANPYWTWTCDVQLGNFPKYFD